MELLLVHVCAGDAAVPFSTFFEPQQTPGFLVSAGIYNASLAIPLYDGEHRKQSVALILRSLLSPPKQRRPPVAWHQIEKEVGGNRNSVSDGDAGGVQVTFACVPPSHHHILTSPLAFRRVAGISFVSIVLLSTHHRSVGYIIAPVLTSSNAGHAGRSTSRALRRKQCTLPGSDRGRDPPVASYVRSRRQCSYHAPRVFQSLKQPRRRSVAVWPSSTVRQLGRRVGILLAWTGPCLSAGRRGKKQSVATSTNLRGHGLNASAASMARR